MLLCKFIFCLHCLLIGLTFFLVVYLPRFLMRKLSVHINLFQLSTESVIIFSTSLNAFKKAINPSPVILCVFLLSLLRSELSRVLKIEPQRPCLETWVLSGLLPHSLGYYLWRLSDSRIKRARYL